MRAVGLVLVWLSVVVAANERVNPFSRPSTEAFAATGGEPAVAAGALTLRGVLSAGASSMANLNGKIVGVGEQAYGYELLAVAEGTATFLKDGKTVMLVVPEAPRGSND